MIKRIIRQHFKILVNITLLTYVFISFSCITKKENSDLSRQPVDSVSLTVDTSLNYINASKTRIHSILQIIDTSLSKGKGICLEEQSIIDNKILDSLPISMFISFGGSQHGSCRLSCNMTDTDYYNIESQGINHSLEWESYEYKGYKITAITEPLWMKYKINKKLYGIKVCFTFRNEQNGRYIVIQYLLP